MKSRHNSATGDSCNFWWRPGVLREKCSTRETSAIVEYEERCTLKIHTYHFGTQSA